MLLPKNADQVSPGPPQCVPSFLCTLPHNLALAFAQLQGVHRYAWSMIKYEPLD